MSGTQLPPSDDSARQDRREALRSLSLPREAPARRRRRRLPRWIVWGISVGVVIGAFVTFQRLTAVPAVRVATVQRSSPIADREITTANGYVVARTRASVASKTQGRLEAVLVDEGDVVEAGQLLAIVDHHEQDATVAEAAAYLEKARLAVPAREAVKRETEAALATAEAAIDERRAAVTEAEAVLAERETSFNRTADLVARGIASEADLDASREARDVARARLTLARTSLATASTDLERARATVEVQARQIEIERQDVAATEASLSFARAARENAFIRAPFAGMVLRREAEPGEVVSPANTGASGSKTAVVTLADFATLEIEVDVYERDIARIAVDTPCRVVLDAYPERPLAGGVRLLRPTADRTRATVQVYVRFASVPEFARPEMGARVSFFAPETDTLVVDDVTVPSAAVVESGGSKGAFVIAGKTVRFQPVELEAGGSDSSTETGRKVLSGLEVGDRVVLTPPVDLADGARITVIDE